MKTRLAIIGNGMAPGRMLEHLLEADPERYRITIFNAEPRVNYDRIMLSPVLSGEKAYEQIIIHGDGWYVDHGITLYKGHRIIAIDRETKTVMSDQGVIEAYDRLVIATGSLPFVIPVPGKDLAGVLSYRDLDDVQAMLLAAQSRDRAVIIGGGLLGLEAAAGLAARGMPVTVLHVGESIMDRQLDPAAGHLLKRALEQRGIEVITRANTVRIVGAARAEGVELDDGRVIPASLVVMAVGIRPNVTLARDSGLAVNRGIVVDDGMRTSDPSIYSLGECAEVGGRTYGLVAPLYQMARVCAKRLLDQDDGGFVHGDTPTKLKVTGVDVYSVGDFADGEDREEIVLRDAAAGVYKRLIVRDNRIIGAVLFGDTGDGPWFGDLQKQQVDIADIRETVIFGQAFQGGPTADPDAAVAALPDDAEICGCNGVCKGRITSTIKDKGLTTLEAVRSHTKASASCGSCTGLVEKLMHLTLGEAWQPAAVAPVCGCTDLGHDEVRRLIKARQLKTIPDVMQALEWKSSCGCAKCRPALNYYLVCDWPGEYEDDYQSRFINERVHANIQKDGTYSVVPRMWGGVTSARELRAIADVVDKFQVPSVKVTGGQRIDLLGVRKEDLPAVWADLGRAGFVSGHAYAKGLRTVKTCVGTDWCRFGTQDSTGLGIRLEKFLWSSWTPAKLKLAVSGCPRNCAESTCKDIGVICVDSGYEIHFGGAAGLEIRGTDRLGQVRTEDEAIEHIAALTQMYREQARYLERIYKWAARVGVDEIRRQIIDDGERRRAYFERFVQSQHHAQIDPWAERVEGRHAHEFQPIARIDRDLVAPPLERPATAAAPPIDALHAAEQAE